MGFKYHLNFYMCIISHKGIGLKGYIWMSLPFFYYYFVCEAIGTAATPGLLCQPRVIMKMIAEKQMECRLAGETDVLGENLPQRHFCPSQNPTWPNPGLNPGRSCGKPATNRMSYGAAHVITLHSYTSLSISASVQAAWFPWKSYFRLIESKLCDDTVYNIAIA
jgi:hypothetical protein